MTTWTPVHSTTFAGPVAPVAAGGTLTDGWVDISGNVWSVDSTGLLRSVSEGSPWNNGLLLRPASENTIDGQITATFTCNSAQTPYFVFRSNRSTTAGNCYIIGIDYSSNKFVVHTYSVVNSAVAQLALTTFTTQPTSGQTLNITINVVQTNSTTTTITTTVTNLAGTVLETVSTTNTASALQNLSGAMGVCMYTGSTGNLVGISQIETYSDVSTTAVTTTAYALGGPTSVVQGSPATYTVTPNGTSGPSSAAVVITPVCTLSGTFSPTTITIPIGSVAPQVFTLTPSASGSGTLSTTNNGSLTDPTGLSLSAVAAITVPISSPAFLFSPGNWRGNAGRSGTTYMQSWNNGAWFKFTWTAGPTPSATILMGATNTSSQVSYFLNGVPILGVAANANVAVSGVVANASNTLWVFLKSSTQSSRFVYQSSANIVQVLGIQIDGNSTAGTAPAAKPWILWVGDSITEGINANAGAADFLSDYSFFCLTTLDNLGYDLGVSACGYSGWITTGDSTADVPAYYSVSGSTNGTGGTYSESASRWDKIDSAQSLLDSAGQISSYGSTGQQPAVIFINYMTNEALGTKNVSDAQASVTQCLAALRNAAPNAWIFIQVPFGMHSLAKYPAAYLTALTAGVAAYQAAAPSDGKVVLIDLGAAVSATIQSGLPYIGTDYTHPYVTGHALLAPMITQAITTALKQASSRSYTFY